MAEKRDNLIWIDLEMTGLDPDHDRIIEMATVVTDGELNVLAEGPVLAIQQTDERLAAMDEWNTRQHGQSGLIERVRQSTVNEQQAEQATIAFLQRRCSPMCGNSICQDRRFLYRSMPTLEAYFHYRNLDVSSIKELVRRWHPRVSDGFEKKGSHLALDDIVDSINELRHYRERFFKLPE